jgi:hypothetical protein
MITLHPFYVSSFRPAVLYTYPWIYNSCSILAVISSTGDTRCNTTPDSHHVWTQYQQKKNNSAETSQEYTKINCKAIGRHSVASLKMDWERRVVWSIFGVPNSLGEHKTVDSYSLQEYSLKSQILQATHIKRKLEAARKPQILSRLGWRLRNTRFRFVTWCSLKLILYRLGPHQTSEEVELDSSTQIHSTTTLWKIWRGDQAR